MWWEPDQDAVRARDRGPFLAASGSDPGKPRRQAGAGVRATECAASTSVDASHLLPCFGATGAPEAKARSLAGLKGYLTNLAACPDGTPVTAEFVIGAYHRLFEIEKSFRMSKHDLQAGPIYHHKRDSIEPTCAACARPRGQQLDRTHHRLVDQEVRPRRPPQPHHPDPGPQALPRHR